MYRKSTEAWNLLRQSNTMVPILRVLHSGKPVKTLTFTDGSINVEGGRSITRNFSGTVVDPDGEMVGDDIDDLLSPYDCEVAPYRGVLLSDGTVELAPQGIFQLNKREVTQSGAMALSGLDRAVIYQGPMDSTLAINGGTSIEGAISQLLTRRNRALKFHAWVTGFTTAPLVYEPDTNVWDAALELAASVGGILFHDRNGELVFSPGLPWSDNPVATYSYGDGVLLDATRAEDTDIHNVVVVKSEQAGTSITATVLDNDPTSPTYAYGKYGYRVVTKTNDHIGTTKQAQQMANTEFAREIGKSETATVRILVDPFLDPNDTILVDYPTRGLVQRSMIIAGFTLPMSASESMTLNCRKSIVGVDGRIIDNGLELT